MKKNFKVNIKTYLCTGIVMGLISIILLLVMPAQVRIPGFDSGAPSPRVLPGACLIVMLICSIYLIIQSLVFKKDKVYVWEWAKEKDSIALILLICLFVALILTIGFTLAGIISLSVMLLFMGERKPSVYLVTWIAVVAIFFMFRAIFHISLPMSPFGLPI